MFRVILRGMQNTPTAMRGDALARALVARPVARRIAMVADPLTLHRKLMPPEMAGRGVYRRSGPGEPGETVVCGRSLSGHEMLDRGAAPGRIGVEMRAFGAAARALLEAPPPPDVACDARCDALSMLFAWYLRVHPFADGNGRVGRLMVWLGAQLLGCATGASWTIDARPYGPGFSYALQALPVSPTPFLFYMRRFFRQAAAPTIGEMRDIYLISGLPGVGDTIGAARTGADVAFDLGAHVAGGLAGTDADEIPGFSTLKTPWRGNGARSGVSRLHEITFMKDGMRVLGYVMRFEAASGAAEWVFLPDDRAGDRARDLADSIFKVTAVTPLCEAGCAKLPAQGAVDDGGASQVSSGSGRADRRLARRAGTQMRLTAG